MSTNSLNTITVDGVTYDAETYAKDHATVKANDELGKDAFLQLLVAQMKYQDPLDPQDNSQYIAELANFSALEQMTNVNTNLESLATTINNIDTSVLVGQLSSMIGKEITWTSTTTSTGTDGKTTSTSTNYQGIVSGISLSESTNPKVVVNLNGTTYRVAISDITNVQEVGTVSNNSSTTTTAQTSTSSDTTQTSSTTTSSNSNSTQTSSTTDTTSTSSDTTQTASTTNLSNDTTTVAGSNQTSTTTDTTSTSTSSDTTQVSAVAATTAAE